MVTALHDRENYAILVYAISCFAAFVSSQGTFESETKCRCASTISRISVYCDDQSHLIVSNGDVILYHPAAAV